MKTPKILLADDKVVVRRTIGALLESEGLQVVLARDGEEALKLSTEENPDLVLLDIEMPKLNGFKVCEKLRERDPLLPIVFLTAKETEVNEIRAFGVGADDFVRKSEMDEMLVAHVRRALARSAALRIVSGETVLDLSSSVTADLGLQQVSDKDGNSTRLTPTECNILRLLSAHRDQTCSPTEILAYLRGAGFACDDSMLYVHICNLRKKLGTAAPLLVTDRNRGYRLLK